MKVLFGYLC